MKMKRRKPQKQNSMITFKCLKHYIFINLDKNPCLKKIFPKNNRKGNIFLSLLKVKKNKILKLLFLFHNKHYSVKIRICRLILEYFVFIVLTVPRQTFFLPSPLLKTKYSRSSPDIDKTKQLTL